MTTRAGCFAYLNFILHNKYFVDGTIRRSGSSQFGPITVTLLSGRLVPVGICTTRRFCRKSGLVL